MKTASVLLVYPGSLWGGAWAARPRVKPELVSIHTWLRKNDVEAMVLDLEAELGICEEGGQAAFLEQAETLLRERPADVVAVSCWSSLQYSATLAVAELARKVHPTAVLAVGGYHPSSRPEEFTFEGTPFNWVLGGEAEDGLLALSWAVGEGDRDTASCRFSEGAPFPLSEDTAPDYASYPYIEEGLPTLPVSLSRGCPFHCTSCVTLPGQAGWRSYPPEIALRLLAQLAELKPREIDVVDTTFGYDNLWRSSVLEELAKEYRRAVPIVVTARPDHVSRKDLDRLYSGSLRVRFDVETLARPLVEALGLDSQPSRHVQSTLDVLRYANAKGIPGEVRLVFGQPGETRETAAETIAVLRELSGSLPNASTALRGEPWAYFPGGAPGVEADAAERRFGAFIARPEWWKEATPSFVAATAVRPSASLSDLEPGDAAYWRPAFDEVAAGLEDKLTAEARRYVRSHESVGSAAADVPHGFYHPER
jgi:radical SAM superfamily enzyme YgiQ (UPF0313 family)